MDGHLREWVYDRVPHGDGPDQRRSLHDDVLDRLYKKDRVYRFDGYLRDGDRIQAGISTVWDDGLTKIQIDTLLDQQDIFEDTYYPRKSNYGGLEVPEAKQLRALKEENGG